MQFDWLQSPVTQYAVTAAGLLGSLGLWIAAKMEIRTVRHVVADTRGGIETDVRELSASVEALREDQARLTAEAEASPAAVNVGTGVNPQGLNLTKRAQIVRMHRRGETVPAIAAALQTPRNEVELVLKLERVLNPAA